MLLLIYGEKNEERWRGVYVDYELKDRIYIKTQKWEDMWLEVVEILKPEDFGFSSRVKLCRVEPAPGCAQIFKEELKHWVLLEFFTEELLAAVR